MPDTLKQLYSGTINVTGLTGNQTATLFTNNATTRAVIKDVDVMNTFPIQPNLTVGGTSVASIVGSLTGSEIADVNQSVGISFTSPLAYTQDNFIYQMDGSRISSTTNYRISGGISKTVASTFGFGSQFSSYAPYTVVTAADGDVFQYATNGSQVHILYKYPGGITGTPVAVLDNSGTWAPMAYNGGNLFYWVDPGSGYTNIRAYNIDTETISTVVTMGVAPNTVPTTGHRLIFSNGYLLWRVDNDSPIIIEISTGRWMRFVGSNASSALGNTSNWPGFFFDTATRTALLFQPEGTAHTYRRLSPVPVYTSGNAYTDWGGAWIANSLANSSFSPYTLVSGGGHVVLSSLTAGYVMGTNSFPCTLSIPSDDTTTWRSSLPLQQIIGTNYWRFNYSTNPSPTVNTTNYPSSISIRITGVEVTP